MATAVAQHAGWIEVTPSVGDPMALTCANIAGPNATTQASEVTTVNGTSFATLLGADNHQITFDMIEVTGASNHYQGLLGWLDANEARQVDIFPEGYTTGKPYFRLAAARVVSVSNWIQADAASGPSDAKTCSVTLESVGALSSGTAATSTLATPSTTMIAKRKGVFKFKVSGSFVTATDVVSYNSASFERATETYHTLGSTNPQSVPGGPLKAGAVSVVVVYDADAASQYSKLKTLYEAKAAFDCEFYSPDANTGSNKVACQCVISSVTNPASSANSGAAKTATFTLNVHGAITISVVA